MLGTALEASPHLWAEAAGGRVEAAGGRTEDMGNRGLSSSARCGTLTQAGSLVSETAWRGLETALKTGLTSLSVPSASQASAEMRE